MNTLACNLQRHSEIPLYEQLYLYIKKEIIEGRLSYGTKLPSKRQLIDVLQISQNTVEAAYDQLRAEGYVEVIPRKGYYVQAFEDLEYVSSSQPEEAANDESPPETLYNFHPSHVDTEHFPFSQWRKYTKNTIDESQHHLLLLGEAQGEIALRREIAHYLYEARGVRCTSEQIIVGAGVEILLQQLFLLFGSETVYGVEDPGYHLILRMLQSYPNEVYPLEVDHEGVKVEAIKPSKIDIVYVTPSHHFPYGTVLSVNRRMQLLNWANSSERRYIIEDDYDSEFRYSGKTIPSLQSNDTNDKVIYLGSFSKSLMPSLRVSYMVLPKSLLQHYQAQLTFYHSTVSRIDQHVLTQFMRQGDFEKHLNRMRKVYRRKLEKVIHLLKPYDEQFSIIGEQSGLHIVLDVHNGMDEDTLVQQAAEARLKVYPLSVYSIEKIDKNAPKIILGFAGIHEGELENAVQLLLKAWGIK
ncbi:PLP-dependent aminotransferase family protein [Peribacillus asahii]|uniref:MocR-like pyridoxine biosynthesis transcription factor PdxR n=1 Tax=Peribacillus asahii TaxID=228899 RepID=UPI003828AFFF